MDDAVVDLFLCGAEASEPLEAQTAQAGRDGATDVSCGPLDRLPIEVIAHVLNGLDSWGRPLLDPLWRFAARATCRLWRDVVGAPTTAEARSIARAWRRGRVDRRGRVTCLCAPCTHNYGGGLKRLVATGRLVTATCIVALGARWHLNDHDGKGNCESFEASSWCALPLPDQDVALCMALAAPTREAVDQVVRGRLAPLFACDADGHCPVRAIERADFDYCKRVHEYHGNTGTHVDMDGLEHDDGKTLILDLLVVAARQGHTTLLASLVAHSEHARAVARDASDALTYYACHADRADTIAWILRNVIGMEKSAPSSDLPPSAPCAPPVALHPEDHGMGGVWEVWRAIARYDAVDVMTMVLDAFGPHVATCPDVCDAIWAPGTAHWQRCAARHGSLRVLELCRARGIVPDFDMVLGAAAARGQGRVVRWALTCVPVAEPAVCVNVYLTALGMAASDDARGRDRDGADLAIDLLCDAIRRAHVSHSDAVRTAVAWWRTAGWRSWGRTGRNCASAVRVAQRWHDLLLDGLASGDALGLFRSAVDDLDYKVLDAAVSLFAGHRAAEGIDLWAMVVDTLHASGTAMRPHRRHYKFNPYGSPPSPRFNRPLHSRDFQPLSRTVPADAVIRQMHQEHAAKMAMFLASVCAHRTRVALATRAQWRSLCVVGPIGIDRLPSVDMGRPMAMALPAWLDERGLLARPS